MLFLTECVLTKVIKNVKLGKPFNSFVLEMFWKIGQPQNQFFGLECKNSDMIEEL